MCIRDRIERPQYDAPKFWLNPDIKDFYQFTTDDIKITDYVTGEQIKAALSPGGTGAGMRCHLPAAGPGPQSPGISADSRPKCLPVFCTAPDIVSGLSEQRRRHPRSNPGGVRCRGTLPPAVRAPFSGSLPAGGPGGGRPLLYRSHALSFVGGSPAIRRSPPVISWPIWNNSFPFSEAQLCRKNAQKVP